jgi:hypothetical protein
VPGSTTDRTAVRGELLHHFFILHIVYYRGSRVECWTFMPHPAVKRDFCLGAAKHWQRASPSVS